MGHSHIFWGELGEEVLRHQSPGEAIEAIIDGLHPTSIDEIGEITVHEFAPMVARAPSHWHPLESLIESLDEEYSNPDGDGTTATEAMLAAEKAFVAAVLAEYKPWMCLPTGSTVTVNALEWVRANCPDWLEAKPRASTPIYTARDEPNDYGPATRAKDPDEEQ